MTSYTRKPSLFDRLFALLRGVHGAHHDSRIEQVSGSPAEAVDPVLTADPQDDVDPMEKSAADALWNEQDDLVFDVQWHDGKPNMGRNSYHEPVVTAIFPDGKSIILRTSGGIRGGMRICDEAADLWTPRVTLSTPDGQQMEIGHSTVIRNAWHAVIAVRVARRFGMHHAAATIDPTDANALPDLIEEILQDNTPTPIDETYIYQDYVRSWSGDTRPPDPPAFQASTPWKRLKDDLRMRIGSERYCLEADRKTDRMGVGRTMSASIACISDDEFGFVSFSGERISDALEEKRRESIRQAFGGQGSKRVPTVMGNAKASRIISLTNEIVRRNPDIADASGTPIAPLVQKHIPRLLNAHAEALRTASTHEIEAIDRELSEGLEVVRSAVEEAMAMQSRRDRGQLATELQFLRLRHPGRGPLAPDEE